MQSALKARVDRPVGDPVPILGKTNMTTSYHLRTRLSRDMNHHSPQVESAHWGQPIKPLHALHLKISWKSRRSLVGCATCAGTSKKKPARTEGNASLEQFVQKLGELSIYKFLLFWKICSHGE